MFISVFIVFLEIFPIEDPRITLAHGGPIPRAHIYMYMYIYVHVWLSNEAEHIQINFLITSP